ncbi:biotin--[acetyl-CoA-carboxylase] ligase [Paenibacillus filicis]|uniref:Bifunctional ligase/repressor BirA n=1 Tax=Paenibacillus gyeongsangnamensis TaxID=3388067 RepID=A0ABT4Q861_9BACL|nr:biotin--[acetyl-CoA-carboxylase] ligase [Paenibacillus filicis]MCZ8512976.1 biotin--[acetyl-CoA-carboxylase] ligase [Paenibacillus filicis]
MTDRLLELFERANGEFVSGEEISGKLQVSRTAIWKQIERLRTQGYEFEAVPRKGYKLLSKPDKLDVADVLSRLQTKVLGRELKYYEQVESTQNIAREWVDAGAPEGTLVVAEMQTAGRGRMGRSWHSPKGKGLWMSLILRPSIPINFTPQLTLLVAVAVCRAIRGNLHLPVGIKWPNDLLIDRKKVCGILLESSAEDERLQHVIVGMGISANLEPRDYSPELAAKATSLAIASGRAIDRTELLCRVMLELEQLYDMYQERGFAPIKSLWEALSVTLDRPVAVDTPKGRTEGTAVSIEDSGALVVRLEDGKLVKMYSGDVEMR